MTEIDNLILDIAQRASLIPRGKTINADMFPEKKALQDLILREKIAELEAAINLLTTPVKKYRENAYQYLNDRLAELQNQLKAKP